MFVQEWLTNRYKGCAVAVSIVIQFNETAHAQLGIRLIETAWSFLAAVEGRKAEVSESLATTGLSCETPNQVRCCLSPRLRPPPPSDGR